MNGDLARLAEPFAPAELEWRVGSVAKSGKSAQLLVYITARAAMDRLDEVVGPERWEATYKTGASGGLICTVSVLCEMPDGSWRWVAKEDGAENTQVEAVKGGMSDAFKRAAVKWGVGRYLYRMPSTWQEVRQGYLSNGVDGCNIVQNRQHIGHCLAPKLPAWALPSRRETPSEATTRQAKQHPSWPDARARFCAKLNDKGIKYDDLARWCQASNRGRPSSMTPEAREACLEWALKQDPQRFKAVQA